MANATRSLQFMLDFVEASQALKSEYVDRWLEVLQNFLVEPYWGQDYGVPGSPYSRARRLRRNKITLKDAETHKAVMGYVANIMLSIFGDGRGRYVAAVPVGYEDAPLKATTADRLIRYGFRRPGHWRTLQEQIVEMLLFGTSVIEVSFEYREREMLARTIEAIGDLEVDNVETQTVVVQDDVVLNPIGVMDFFPDPSEYRVERMVGAAKRFAISESEARRLAALGVYDEAETSRALSGGPAKRTTTEHELQTYSIPRPRPRPEGLENHDGFEYWGEVPWSRERRVITVVNEVVVRDQEYPLADPDLPFRTMTISPIRGRFYGVSPAETMRFDQDLQDALRILVAEAVIRQVHPPLIYNRDSDVDYDYLLAWTPDAPVGIRGGIQNVGTLRYDANVFTGLQFGQTLKQDMRETSGATGPFLGFGLGVNRASGTEAQFTAQQSLSRPELAAALLEKEDLPAIARSMLRRYQQFLPSTEELRKRIGELPAPVWIGEIMGDFDIYFVGSRRALSHQAKLQAYDRLIALSTAVPAFAAMIPWREVALEMFGETIPELAARIAEPQTMRLNLLLSRMLGRGRGTPPRPAEASPAELAGGTLV
jgi:hypothetical protein